MGVQYRSGTKFICCPYCFYLAYKDRLSGPPRGVHTCTCNPPNPTPGVWPGRGEWVDALAALNHSEIFSILKRDGESS